MKDFPGPQPPVSCLASSCSEAGTQRGIHPGLSVEDAPYHFEFFSQVGTSACSNRLELADICRSFSSSAGYRELAASNWTTGWQRFAWSSRGAYCCIRRFQTFFFCQRCFYVPLISSHCIQNFPCSEILQAVVYLFFCICDPLVFLLWSFWSARRIECSR